MCVWGWGCLLCPHLLACCCTPTIGHSGVLTCARALPCAGDADRSAPGWRLGGGGGGGINSFLGSRIKRVAWGIRAAVAASAAGLAASGLSASGVPPGLAAAAGAGGRGERGAGSSRVFKKGERVKFVGGGGVAGGGGGGTGGHLSSLMGLPPPMHSYLASLQVRARVACVYPELLCKYP